MNKTIKILFLPFVIGLLFTACQQKSFDTKEQLLEYLKAESNSYLQSKTVKGVTYSLLYKPTDLLVHQEASDFSDVEAIDSLRKKYRNYLYFNLSMSKNDRELLSNVAQNKQKFGAMVNELSFGMDQKIHVYTSSKDTIPMVDYVYPRMYGMSGATTLLLVYPRDLIITEQGEITLTMEDIGFYTGEVKFKIPIEIFNKEPQLNFSKQ